MKLEHKWITKYNETQNTGSHDEDHDTHQLACPPSLHLWIFSLVFLFSLTALYSTSFVQYIHYPLSVHSFLSHMLPLDSGKRCILFWPSLYFSINTQNKHPICRALCSLGIVFVVYKKPRSITRHRPLQLEQETPFFLLTIFPIKWIHML